VLDVDGILEKARLDDRGRGSEESGKSESASIARFSVKSITKIQRGKLHSTAGSEPVCFQRIALPSQDNYEHGI
jgi:hypothetical protein